MLILSNNEIQSLLDMPAVIEALKRAYAALGNGDAVNAPTVQTVIGEGDHVFSFRQSAGALRRGVQALRINSDIVTWVTEGQHQRQRKVPAAHGRYVGLTYLFEVASGSPLAIFPDGTLQQYRVGGTNGLAARYLAPSVEAPEVALLGSGWQAQTQLLAAEVELHPRIVRVYSPDPGHREAFCAHMAPKIQASLVAVATPAEAVEGADVVLAATSSVDPVLDTDWIVPGRFFSVIDPLEVSQAFVSRVDRLYVHSRAQTQALVSGIGSRSVPKPSGWWAEAAGSAADLADLVSGRDPGRRESRECLLFVNNVGLGLQFAAVGELVYQRAIAAGIGRTLPDEWFTQVEPS